MQETVENRPIEAIMTGILMQKLLVNSRSYLTDAELESLLDGSPDSRYGKVKRMLANDKLLRIRRGLYCLTDKIGYVKTPHPFELAQYIYGPSYISLESALSYHGLIPEAVYTITSATSKRTKEFQTPLGLFYFRHLPLENLFTAVELIKENDYSFFMAKPWKAICDYIFCYKKDWVSLDPLLESLRIDLVKLPQLSSEEIQLLEEYYNDRRISRFLRNILKIYK